MKTVIRVVTMSALACLVAGTAVAGRWVIPAGAHATGAQDTNWRTDLQLVNPTSSDATATVYLLRKNQDNSNLGESSTHTVIANGQVVVGDIFFSDFSYSGTGGLLVECDNPDLVVTSRTYNLLDDHSTYGQFIPGVKVGDALPASHEGHIIYLAKSDSFRSNVGFCAASAAAGSATVNMYDESGVQTGTATRTYQGFGQFQWNDIFDVTGSAPSTAARAVIMASSPIVAYGSVVDERTGDPVAVTAEVYENIAFGESVISAAARATGAEGSLWRTDIRIFNPTDTSRTVSLDYYKKGTNNGPQNSSSSTVGPGSILALDDAMMTAFGLESANGAVRVLADQPVMVWSRTYNQSENGTFGQSIPAKTAQFELHDDETLIYTGLSDNGFRSNVGFFNLEDEETTLLLSMVDETGTGVADFYNIGPDEMNQINDVFDWIGLDGANGYYSLRIMGESDVIAFVSIIDNISNDPVYQPGEVRTAGGGGGGGGGGPCVTLPQIPDGTVTTHNISGLQEFLGQNLPFDGEHRTTYVETTATENTIDIQDELSVTFGGSTVDATAEATLEFEFHILDDPSGYLGLDRDSNHLEYTFIGNTTTTDTVTTYDPAKVDPAKVSGPSATWCEGATWMAPSVNVTTEVDDDPPEQSSSPTEEGEVHSITEVISVPAGTFTTVWYTVTTTSGDRAGSTNTLWLDVESGLPVKQEVRDPIGLLTLYLALTDVQ